MKRLLRVSGHKFGNFSNKHTLLRVSSAADASQWRLVCKRAEYLTILMRYVQEMSVKTKKLTAGTVGL